MTTMKPQNRFGLLIMIMALLALVVGLVFDASRTAYAQAGKHKGVAVEQNKTAPKALTDQDAAKAELFKTQAMLVEKEREILRLRQTVLACQEQALGTQARTLEQDFRTKLGAKNGEQFDWNTLTMRAAAAK